MSPKFDHHVRHVCYGVGEVARSVACQLCIHMSLVLRKQVFWVSNQVLHKPGCIATEDG